MIKGTVLNIKQFEIHDGPGIRTTLFLKGCPLRCLWCHNPESIKSAPQTALYVHKCVSCGACAAVCPNGAHQIDGNGTHSFFPEKCRQCGKCVAVCPKGAMALYGKTVTPAEILPELLEDKPFFDVSGGGVTVSGGEPLLQSEFTAELLRLLKENSVHTALDTSLYASKAALDRVIPYTDLFLVDVKAADPSVHKKLTGVDNKLILDNLRYVDSLGLKYEIRIPYVPGMNDVELLGITELLLSLTNLGRVKLLPYHDLARSKYSALQQEYGATGVPVPSANEFDAVLESMRAKGINAVKE